ncbi:uncharacterized protein LOC143299715 [Babylonia areolata]|uniref:uncharacterized protein LOC143299715 n=1 Tax=Babylonia areolata TaxID=304850 RepID=UPI003FD15FBF
MTKENPEEGVSTERPDDTPALAPEEDPPSAKADQFTADNSSTTSASSTSSEDTTSAEDQAESTPPPTPAEHQPVVTNEGESKEEAEEGQDNKWGDSPVIPNEEESNKETDKGGNKGEEDSSLIPTEESNKEDSSNKGDDPVAVTANEEGNQKAEEEEDKGDTSSVFTIEIESTKEESKGENSSVAANKQESNQEDNKGNDSVLTTKEEESNKDVEEEGEEGNKGDNSQSSGRDVTDMEGRGDSMDAEARTAGDLKAVEEEASPADVTTAEDKVENDSAAEPKTSEAEGTQQPSPTPDAVPPPAPTDSGTAEGSAPAEVNHDGHEETGERAPGVVAENRDDDAQAPHYEDDFSEMSEVSERATAAATSADMNGTTPQERKSPTPSCPDEARADAGAVVPVPMPMKKSDGRSFTEERGEVRGEDRNEVQCEEGSDSRGQGQWKSEEELVLQSSLANQQAEKEALQTVIDEKVKVQKDFDDLKGRYVALEESSRHWEQDASALKETCQEQGKHIRELESEQARLREFEQWGKDNEAKVKDLQDRLAALAGEDADKDRRLQKLQEELHDTRSRLVTAERQVAISNEAAIQQQRPVQQSKTCTIL